MKKDPYHHIIKLLDIFITGENRSLDFAKYIEGEICSIDTSDSKILEETIDMLASYSPREQPYLYGPKEMSRQLKRLRNLFAQEL